MITHTNSPYNPLHLLFHQYLIEILIQLLLCIEFPVQFGHLRIILLKRPRLPPLEISLHREHQLDLGLLDVVVELLVQLRDLLLPLVDDLAQSRQLVLTLIDDSVDVVLRLVLHFVHFRVQGVVVPSETPAVLTLHRGQEKI